MMQSAAGRLETLLDSEEFARALASAEQPLVLFRETLRRGADNLRADFETGVAVEDLVNARAKFIDALLRRAWQRQMPADAAATLVAVGGYGRGDLHPGSDIDLMILLGPDTGNTIEAAIEQLLMFLWDIGLEVGHSVRTLEDCVREATQDVTVVTNLMESRWLAGSRALFDAMLRATAPERLWPSDQFFEAKREEQRRRHLKYDDAFSRLEPNIKDSPGGLRDIQTIDWVARRHFGAATMHDLVDHGFLSESEYAALRSGQLFLWRIRFALHLMTGRREDRLLFDYQRTLAASFGYTDQEHALGVEQFMQAYYRTVMELAQLNEMLLQLFQEAILLKRRLDPPVALNSRFQARNGFIEVTRKDVFRRYPVALLEIFLLLQTHSELQGVRASTIRLIREHRHLIDDKFRRDLRATSLFMEILRQPQGITHVMRRMNRYGILAAYIQAFANIVGRMQYDLFHVYTVDEHTLFVVRNLRRLMVPAHRDEYPLASAIADALPKRELIFLAALFHDIAKGRGGDHSLLGASDAREFCQRHHLSDYDSDLVAWLVEKHLLMSMTAQRRDISDPDVVQAFAAEIGDTNRLDYLYLLTMADIRATNPMRWNQWKDSLLRELYTATRAALLRGLDNPQAQDELIQNKQAAAARLLERQGIFRERYLSTWLNYSVDYFLNHSPEEIAWQTRLVLESDPEALPLVELWPETGRGGTEIFLHVPDRQGLFAQVTAVLDQLRLTVVDARILTTDAGQSLNTYIVLESDGSVVDGAGRQQEIRQALRDALTHQTPTPLRVSRRMPRQHKHFETPTQISFSEDKINARTVMRLVTGDRPGLLAKVGQAFASCKVRLTGAKITTIGAEVEDVFFITDEENCALSDRAQFDCLYDDLVRRLSAAAD